MKNMKLLPTSQIGAYIRKMAIDGYIIYTGSANIKEMNKELQSSAATSTRLQSASIPPAIFTGMILRSFGKDPVRYGCYIEPFYQHYADYICNPAKTDGSLLIHSYGCSPETADIEFEWTRDQAREPGPHLARHLIQAFSPGETTPQQAHEIGKQLADEVLGGRFEYVLTTHIDRNHIHNHIIFNDVSFVDFKHSHVPRYTEDAIKDRIERRTRAPKAPRQSINLLIDIQNNIKVQESKGYEH